MILDSDDLASLRLAAGLSREDAARIFGRSTRTWRRWETDGAPPAWVAPLLRLVAGDLGRWRGWKGWRIRDGGIRSATGLELRPGMLEGFAIFTELQRHLIKRLAYLERRAPECAGCLWHLQANDCPGWVRAPTLEDMEALAAGRHTVAVDDEDAA